MKTFFNGGYPYNHFIYFYKELVTTNEATSLNQSITEYADLYISSQQLKQGNNRLKKTTEFLYPHLTDCLKIIVPKIADKHTFIIKLIKNQYCQSIGVVFILMTLFKSIFDRIVTKKWKHDIFKMLSIFLAQSKPSKSNQLWESIWLGLFVALSLITTAILSALCYKTIVSIQSPKQINSLDDLIASNLTIFVSNILATDIEAWGSNLNPKLTKKIVIDEKLYMESTEEFAFVWPEGMAEMVLKLTPLNVTVRKTRIMKESLYCGLVSHRVPFKSPLKQVINTVFRRMIEHGLRHKQLEWSTRFFNNMALKQEFATQAKISESVDQPLNLSQLSGVFIMYAFGICTSFGAALIEWSWNRIRYTQIWRNI